MAPRKTRERNSTPLIDHLELLYKQRLYLLAMKRVPAPKAPERPLRVCAPRDQPAQWTKKFRDEALVAFRRAIEYWLRARIADCDDVLCPKPKAAPPPPKRVRSLFEFSDIEEEEEEWKCF